MDWQFIMDEWWPDEVYELSLRCEQEGTPVPVDVQAYLEEKGYIL